MAQSHRCNEQIRLSPVRLIDETNEQIGVVSTEDALRRAQAAGLDLVEVAPNERPPVCRIMDYGKFKYAQSKKKARHHEQRLKEIRLRLRTGEHDREIKMNQALAFLEKGDKVQFTLVYRGRERFHQDMGRELFNQIIQQLGDKVKVESPPRGMGPRLTMVVSPVKH